MRRRRVLLGLSMAACAVLTACAPAEKPTATSSSETRPPAPAAPAPTVAAPPMTLADQPQKWVDLLVGDCIAAVPAVELGEVTVSIVDCGTPHAAEVYLRAPVQVDAAVTDVANQACVAGLPDYTGRSVDGSPYSVTYLIDSRQDRTSNNPLPSTVICMVQSASGRPLTESVRA